MPLHPSALGTVHVMRYRDESVCDMKFGSAWPPSVTRSRRSECLAVLQTRDDALQGNDGENRVCDFQSIVKKKAGAKSSKAPAHEYHYRTNTNAARMEARCSTKHPFPQLRAIQKPSSSSHHPLPLFNPIPFPPSLLDRNPRNRNHNIHALLLRGFPLVAVGAVLVVVPEGADGAVHAAAAVLLGLRGGANVLDHGAVGDVFVGGLGGLGGGRGAGFVDEGFEDGVLGRVLVGICAGGVEIEDEENVWRGREEYEGRKKCRVRPFNLGSGMAYDDGGVPLGDLVVVVCFC